MKPRHHLRPSGKYQFHTSCDACGSSDGNAVYDNNTAHCFVCGAYTAKVDMDGTETEDTVDTPTTSKFINGDFQDIPKRKLSEEVCQKFNYMVGEYKGQPCHIANYYDPVTRRLIAQKIRLPKSADGKKKFTIIGQGKGLPFYGQHMYNGGKSVVITEGEIDAVSVAMAMGKGKWPVVSLPNGSGSVIETIETYYDWLDTFEKIVLCFDQDEPGRKALEQALPLLPPGKAYIMTLPLKDANEVLLELGPQPISDAFWNAQQWRPDGIVSGEEISLESLMEAINPGFSTPFPLFNERYGGIRKQEILLLTAGSGIGKSTLARELGYALHQTHGLRVGNVFLEESNKKTAQGYIAIDNNVPLGKLRANPALLTKDQWQASYDKLLKKGLFFYDHFGSLDSARLLSKLRYMATALKCDFIILDHISIVVSGQEGSGEGERRDIDMLMTKLRQLVEETGVGVIAIVHLKQPEGKPHEEGGRVTLSQLRGSGSLKQLSDGVLALERDQQGENSAVCTARLLKNREFGDTGEIDHIEYDKATGRMNPTTTQVEYDSLDV